jgi:methylated-DNA-[protein]-cysteine S-methyltransferase
MTTTMISPRPAAAPDVTTFTTTCDSPIGRLRVQADADGRLLQIDLRAGARPVAAVESATRCAHVLRQLAEYWRGARRAFDLELALGGTPFEQRVWHELLRIPYGTTISYKELALRIDNPRATRAVGRANGANPIPIVIPCHRVIAADGTLGGYGGGIAVKRRLLRLEGWSAVG